MALIAPQGLVTPAGVMPRLKQFTVAGIFEAGIADADARLALVHLDDAQALYRWASDVSGVRLKLDDLFAARGVARELQAEAAAGAPPPPTGRAATPPSSTPSRSRSG